MFTYTRHRVVGTLLLGLCGLSTIRSQAQGGNDVQDKFVVPSQNAKTSSVVAVGGTPVNLYTGTMSPQVPLLTLPGRNLSTAVGLSYNAGNGVQVTSVAGEVGTGWDLVAGGAITCEMRGKPDQLSKGDKRWITPLMNRDTNPVRDIQDNQLCNEADTELDVYHLNAPGLQADFVVHGPYGTSNPKTVDVRVLNDRNLTVVPVFFSNTAEIYQFVVTDALGTQYVFDEREYRHVKTETKNLTRNSTFPASEYEYTATYFLSRITDIAKESVYFTYNVSTAAPQVYKSASQMTTAYIRCDTNGNNCQTRTATSSPDPFTFNYETTTTITSPYRRQLAMIFSDAGTVTFYRGKVARLDAPGEFALDRIVLAPKNGRTVQTCLLNYGYFGSTAGSPNKDDIRLKLTGVTQLLQGCYSTTTTFGYKETAPVSRRGVNRDYWGYFNTNTSACLLPSLPGESRFDCGDRTANAGAMQNCLLERIENSAGSFTAFEFAAHQDARYQTIGGVRLTAVVVGDVSNRSLDQRFEVAYNTFNVNSPASAGSISSPVIDPPQCYDWQWYRDISAKICDSGDDQISKFLYRNTEPLVNLAPDYVHYQWVTIKYPNNSRTAYKFTSAQDFPDLNVAGSAVLKLHTNLYESSQPCYQGRYAYGVVPPRWFGTCTSGDPYSPDNRGIYTTLGSSERPYGVKTTQSYRRGLVLEMTEVDASNNLATSTQNQYGNFDANNALTTSTPLRSAVVAKEQELFSYGTWSYYYNIRVYDLPEIWMPLTQQISTVYNQRKGTTASTGSRSTYTQYVYQGFMVSRIVSRDSYYADKYDVVEYLRVKDNPYAYYPLWAAKAYGTILKKILHPGLGQSYAGGTLPAGFETCYDYTASTNGSGGIIMHRAGTLNPAFSSAGYQYKASTVQRDTYNNPVNVLLSDGVPQATLWGYGGLLPIANVTNGILSLTDYEGQEASTVGHTSFEEWGAADGWWPVQEFCETEAKTGSRSIKLDRVVSEWGTGRKFRLPPAHQHGKYTFSCWAKLPRQQTASNSFTMVAVLKDGTANQNQLRWFGNGAQVSSNQDWQRCQVVVNLDDPTVRSLLPSGQDVVVQCYIWLNGNNPVLLDEFRFSSSEARLTTMTYQPMVGKTSSTDENQVTTYYEYADDNSPLLVRDEKGNIIKRTKSRLASASPTITVNVDHTGNQYAGQEVLFTASVPRCVSNVTYYWNFGDGTAAVKGEATQKHTYQQTGNYPLTVVAEAADVDPAEYSQLVRVVGSLELNADYSGNSSYDLCTRYPNGAPSASITVLPQAGCGGPFTYNWEMQEYTSYGYGSGYGSWSGWQSANNTTNTYGYTHSSARQVQVRCTVRDACGNQEVLDGGFYTYYSSPNCGGGGGGFETERHAPSK